MGKKKGSKGGQPAQGGQQPQGGEQPSTQQPVEAPQQPQAGSSMQQQQPKKGKGKGGGGQQQQQSGGGDGRPEQPAQVEHSGAGGDSGPKGKKGQQQKKQPGGEPSQTPKTFPPAKQPSADAQPPGFSQHPGPPPTARGAPAPWAGQPQQMPPQQVWQGPTQQAPPQIGQPQQMPPWQQGQQSGVQPTEPKGAPQQAPPQIGQQQGGRRQSGGQPQQPGSWRKQQQEPGGHTQSGGQPQQPGSWRKQQQEPGGHTQTQQQEQRGHPQQQRGQQQPRGRGGAQQQGRGRGQHQEPQSAGGQQPGGQPQQSVAQQQGRRQQPGEQTQQQEQGSHPKQQGQGGQGRGRGGGQQQGRGRGQDQEPQSPGRSQQPTPSPSPAPSTGSVGSLTSKMSQASMSDRDRRPRASGDADLVSKSLIKPGSKGRKIPVESNHLDLNLGTLKEAYHYDVNIDPNVPKKFLRPVVEIFRKRHFPNRHPAFDGMKNIYASKPLSGNLNDVLSDEIVITPEEGARDKVFKVEIKYANTVDLSPLRDFLRHPTTPQEALQCVDVVLRSAPVVTCLPVGRSFFVKPQRIIDLGQGMEMYNGFYQSAIRGWKPLLNVDVAHKAFPKDMPVIDALAEVITDNPRQPYTRDDLTRDLQPYQLETFRKFITTLRVTYEIPNHPGTRRGFRVNGIDQCARDKKFTQEGRQITIANYFQQVKNYRLRYPHLPTLWVGSMQRVDKVLLPLELCFINEGQAVNRKMTENQTSNMIRYAATNTQVRKDKIMNGLRQANYNSNPVVREFGFSVSSEFQKLEARVLQPPSLAYANRQVTPSRGVWRNDRFLEGITINNWTIVSVTRYPPRGDDLPNMARMLRRHASECGMNFANDAVQPFAKIEGRQTQKDIEQYFRVQQSKKFDIIFVVVPDSGPQYSYVKSAAELNVGCLTQCIKSRTLGRFNPQTAVNILLKVNSKLNGKNHCLATRPRIMGRPVMIMGADVTHPSPDSTNIPSVAAVTASHDPKAFQYNICWRLQPPKVEIIEDLQNIVEEQLRFFFSKTKVKPEAIVFFRDGVSEGQFEQVKNAEIRAIRAACKKLQPEGYEPKITFLVVQKRHHTRLFPLNPRDSEDKNMNVPAGTCVDTTITHPYMQDFYLVSHASIQGVAKPTKYCTLWDDNDMDNDQVEELTYYLCHMFTRCNRSVSYPAPTYYAHLAAARGKVYIENDNLNLNRLQDEFRKYQIKDEIRKGLPMFFV